MSLLSNIFKRKPKQEFFPSNAYDDSQAARVYDEEVRNTPLTRAQMANLPKGLTPTPYPSNHISWDSKPSKFIPRTKYNEPKAITAKQRRQYALLKNV